VAETKVNSEAERKKKEFYAAQDRTLNALKILTLVVDERGRETTVEYLAKMYSVPESVVSAGLAMAVSERLARIGTTSDGQETFTATDDGWKRLLLMWITRHGLATEQHLVDRFGISEQQSKMFMEWGVHKKLLLKGGILRAEPEIFKTTNKAKKMVGLAGLPTTQVAGRTEGHSREMVTRSIRLELEYRYTHELVTERELFRLNKESPDAKAEAPKYEGVANPIFEGDASGRIKRKRADMVLIPRSGDKRQAIAIEVELSPKSFKQLVKYFIAWKSCRSVKLVIYYAAPKVAPLLRRVAEKVGAGKKIEIVDLPPEEVPSQRREEYYEPLEIPDSQEYYSGLGSHAIAKIRNDLLEIVEWIGWHGYVPVEAIATRFARSESDACQMLVLAHGAGWLDYTVMLREEGALFHITAKGRAELIKPGIDLPPEWDTYYALVIRQAICARVAAKLETEHKGYLAKAMVEIRSRRGIGGTTAVAVAPMQARVVNRRSPDLELVSRTDPKEPKMLVFIETEPSYPIPRDMLEKFNTDDDVEQVIYFAERKPRSKAAKSGADKPKPKTKVTVKPMPFSREAEKRRKETREAAKKEQKQSPGKFDEPQMRDCSDESHEPRMRGTSFKGVADPVWAEICREFPQLACGPIRSNGVCSRSALNGILYVLANGGQWDKLPTRLGYGSGMTGMKRLAKFREEGQWPRLQEIIEKREAYREINWDLLYKKKRRSRKKAEPSTTMPMTTITPTRCGSSHEPLEEVNDFHFWGVRDETWDEIVKKFPKLACANRRRGVKGTCNRAALNGTLYILTSGLPWGDLPPNLGYGSWSVCYQRLRAFRENEVWDGIREIIEDRERDRQVDWNRALQASR
jgi:transposase